MAEDLIHFSEDQFVVWERPYSRDRTWFTPSVMEQYRCYTPVIASVADMIIGYIHAWKATGKRLYLEKAKALGNTVTIAQRFHGGRYPTWVNKTRGLETWLNCELYCIKAMLSLEEACGD